MRKRLSFAACLFFVAVSAPTVFAEDANISFSVAPGATQVIDKWTFKKTIKNNCPSAVYVPANTSAEWVAFYSKPPACVQTSDAYCGDGVCDASENESTCAADCDRNVYATGANTATCYDAGGGLWSTTGKGAESWFQYGGCPQWKTYQVTPGATIKLNASGDNCAPCICYHLHFCVSELINGVWVQKACFNLGDGPGAYGTAPYTPSSGQIMITTTMYQCFYFGITK